MTKSVEDSLSNIEAALTRLRRHVTLEALQPGASVEDVHDQIARAGFASVPGVEALYGWRDGTSTGVGTLDDLSMFPGFYLLSLGDAVRNYQAFVTDRRWRQEWLPLFANGGGDFYILDFASSAERPVRHFRIDATDHPIEFSSIADMLATLAQAFENQVFFVDENGHLEMDDLEFGRLAAELNPHISWWVE